MLSLASLALLAMPQEPVLLSRSERLLPELGRKVHDERWLDHAGRRIERRTIAEDGSVVDLDELRREDLARRDQRLGKLHPELAAVLATAAAEETIDAVFWLRPTAAAPDLRAILDRALLAGQSAEEARRAALAAATAANSPGNIAFAAAATQLGGVLLHRDSITPVVFVRATAPVLRALAARADVDLAYQASKAWEPEGELPAGADQLAALVAAANEWASKTARTDVVHRRGITGQGVKVLVNDTGPTATNNPFLPPVVAGRTGTSQAHATAVAGIIASSHPQHHGAAPGLTQLYCYGGSGDTVAPQAWAWGMAQGISFGNCSWWNGQKGRIQFLDRYFDYIIRHFAVMLFKSAGNQGSGDALVTTPGNGYNMIAVGNADDRNNHDWKDDVMNNSSSWRNPLEGHSKPEVTACGTTITTTTRSSPWIGAQGSGTSYAAPVACGIAALLAETDPVLQARPEAVRALLMAGAFHNIEGDAALSDRDGTGHVNAAASQSATARGQFHTATLQPSSFVQDHYEVVVPLLANDETRICAVWFSLADSSYATDVLQMDLDMTVWLGNTLVASSASAANAFEIVQFVPPTTGNYTVRLQRQLFLGQSEPFALAWVTRRNAATNEVVVSGQPVPGGTLQFDFFDRYHPGALYLAALSLGGPPASVPVGPLKVLELAFDGVTEASLIAPGFFGQFPGTGQATATLTLPNLPWLTGLSLHAAVGTLDFSLAEIFEETSPTTSFVLQ